MPVVLQVFVLAVVQGLCELLPVSSSAHVILAEKLMGLDPTTPAMTFLLVMLHTGTMLAVIGYFWNTWRRRFFSSAAAFMAFARNVIIATVCTGVLGLGLTLLIERVLLGGAPGAAVEQLFGNMTLIACALALVGVMIIWSGLRSKSVDGKSDLQLSDSVWIGTIQGLCLPFRGFSRSGATISTGLLRGLRKDLLEDFSFALAVVLTPAVILREGARLYKAQHAAGLAAHDLGPLWPSLAGMLLSFIAGWLALKWLGRWLEHGRWHLFGYYCLVAALAVFITGRLLGAPAV
ncbi:MAG TPA: undecaprenyl-diphosphate phosphatase [Steroidobacteraceae bacterium]|jgi:undecaprenyl-diphosphatase